MKNLPNIPAVDEIIQELAKFADMQLNEESSQTKVVDRKVMMAHLHYQYLNGRNQQAEVMIFYDANYKGNDLESETIKTYLTDMTEFLDSRIKSYIEQKKDNILYVRARGVQFITDAENMWNNNDHFGALELADSKVEESGYGGLFLDIRTKNPLDTLTLSYSRGEQCFYIDKGFRGIFQMKEIIKHIMTSDAQ